MNKPTDEQRFWRKTMPRLSDGGCIPWIGTKDRCGYGRFLTNGKKIPAHRFVWTLKNGPIPKGLFVCHKCDNPACVNPDHLFLGTHTDNVRDCMAKGRKYYPVKKTHCFRGHEYSGANLRIKKDGQRECVACGLLRARNQAIAHPNRKR